MGGRLQAGDRVHLTLRAKLLLATIAIVAVSLALSGGLTALLVGRLATQAAQDQLARNVVLLKPQVAATLCPTKVDGRCVVPDLDTFRSEIAGLPVNLEGERFILLDRPPSRAGVALRSPRVLYDSGGSLTSGLAVPVGRSTTLAGVTVREGTVSLAGEPYYVAAAPLATRYTSFIVLGRSKAEVQAAASRQLVGPLLIAGGAGLALALIATVLLYRTFSRPLQELRGAAEDVARGNYGRRVQVRGHDEIAVVGESFNRMAEAVERSRGAQRDFLANVSHELKTPLTSLIGFSQALVDGSLTTDAERLRAATIINEESERVLRMSRELLDLARVESGQVQISLQPVDLGAQLQQELDMVRQRAAERCLRLHLVLPSALAPVRADPERLHQILENLLDNAVKYAPLDSEITLSAWELEAGRTVTTVANRVSGTVPDPDRLFERFYRADPARPSTAGGVGLG
ncbi:MAG: HAMP domain-containing histidine kinase, partial [Candidatus Dormibacteraeota bacterium]|nr:HAMP domain-containing histidine kinase [Candidatus Dormibacteraeota bacterium]